MYQALYRKWRPTTFDDVCGQSHITEVLRYETSENRVSHAYLFCGPRGTGKTTCAKILAKAINCQAPVNGNPCGHCAACQSVDSENSTDVLELDAASNNGVEHVRAIRDEVNYTPVGMKYRVYIIDEVHMLSISAFNALLKTLEEPPAHVVFILATTELQKLPSTIISRCQRFDFHSITANAIADRLSYIAEKENIDLSPEAARILARHANGGMRDAISLLDLCSSGGEKLTAERVEEQLGISSTEGIRRLTNAVVDADMGTVLSIIADTASASMDIAVFWKDVLRFYRDMLVAKTASAPEKFLDYSAEELARVTETASRYSYERLLYHIRLLDDAYERMQRSNSAKRLIAELTFVRMSDPTLSDEPTALLTRIADLEERVSSLALGITPAETKPAKSKADKPIQKTENSKASAKAPTAPSPTVSEKPVGLKPLSYWRELVESLSKENRSAMGMRDGSRAYKDAANAKIVVRFKNEFTMKLNASDAIRSRLSALLSAKEGCAYTPDDILFELKPADAPEEDDFFDSIDDKGELK